MNIYIYIYIYICIYICIYIYTDPHEAPSSYNPAPYFA